jgi:hypothetical protein
MGRASGCCPRGQGSDVYLCHMNDLHRERPTHAAYRLPHCNMSPCLPAELHRLCLFSLLLSAVAPFQLPCL